MTHYHVGVVEIDGKKRTGALATTIAAAEQEKRIEEEADPRRVVDILQCNLECFGKRLDAA